MSWEIWLAFATISAANIVTPGPAILNTVRRATQLGFAPVLPTILANALGLGVAAAFYAGGVAAFILTSELLWNAFRLLGVSYLAWLGLRLIFVRETLDLDTGDASAPRVSPWLLGGEAFTLAVTNPKAVLFFIAIFPQISDPTRSLFMQAGIMIATYCAISIASLCTYAGLANAVRARLLTQNRYMIFRRISGVVLLAFAGKLASEAR